MNNIYVKLIFSDLWGVCFDGIAKGTVQIPFSHIGVTGARGNQGNNVESYGINNAFDSSENLGNLSCEWSASQNPSLANDGDKEGLVNFDELACG